MAVVVAEALVVYRAVEESRALVRAAEESVAVGWAVVVAQVGTVREAAEDMERGTQVVTMED